MLPYTKFLYTCTISLVLLYAPWKKKPWWFVYIVFIDSVLPLLDAEIIFGESVGQINVSKLGGE